MKYLLWVLFFYAQSSFAFPVEEYLQKAQSLNLKEDKEWTRLGHYIDDPEYGWLSEADGLKFFLSSKGKNHPDRELEATIRQIFSGAPLNDEHPRCKFPARYEYLTRKLSLDFNMLPESKCELFSAFKKRLSTDSISLIFSSYYINNPSSTFGHTLLRMNKKRDPMMPNSELLDFGINFGANPWTDNPLIYTFGGIVGWFPGTFSNVPYHMKVREYNDHESRDLWSYKLNLKEPEIRQLERHLWELGETFFNYYFFAENCSYHLLRAIETAAPRLNLTFDLPGWVIPSDTILYTYNRPDLVTEVSFRPSNLKLFLTRYELLNENQKAIFHKKVDEKYEMEMAFANESNESSAQILDTLIDYYDFKNTGKLLDKTSPESHFKQKLLMARAKNPIISPDLVVTEPSQKPHLAHPSLRLGLEAGYSEKQDDFQNLHIRFALHDFLDPDYGYPPNAQIEFLNLIIKNYNNSKNQKIDQATLVSVKSLAPRNFYSPNKSWSMELGLKTFYDEQCESLCTGGYLQNAWGVSYQFFKAMPLTLFILGEGEVNYTDSFREDNFRLILGPRAGALLKIKDNFKVMADAIFFYDPIQDYHFYQSNFGAHYSFTKQYALRLNGKSRNDDLEGSLTFFFYH